jgi:hypothetical protein
MEHARYLGYHEKIKHMNCGCRRRGDTNDNLFNRIIAENFSNLEKERVTQVQEAYRTPNHQDQKRNTHQTHHNQNTQHTE